jgi:predicted aldo/keto reductase-like oxidoreductase
MEKRLLGKTGERLSVIGFGGVIIMHEEQKTASRYVSMAIDRGINYFDVAPLYGNAQQLMGPALKPYRDNSFLACKTLRRTAARAETELAESLRLLKTDYLDLYQLHEVSTIDEVETILGSGGALETLTKAKEKGLVRYLGFTAHTEEAALALIKNFDFDTILFPINWVCWIKNDFGPKVLKRAREKNMGILAIKAMAKRMWKENEDKKWPKCWYSPVDDFEEADLALRFTLSKPVTSAIASSHVEFLWWACDIAENFRPITEEEINILTKKTKNLTSIIHGLLDLHKSRENH